MSRCTSRSTARSRSDGTSLAAAMWAISTPTAAPGAARCVYKGSAHCTTSAQSSNSVQAADACGSKPAGASFSLRRPGMLTRFQR